MRSYPLLLHRSRHRSLVAVMSLRNICFGVFFMLWMTTSKAQGTNCGSPGTVTNGMVTSNGTVVTSIATYTCDVGYMLNGDGQRVCQPNGMWSSTPPTCPIVDCGPPGIPTDGNAVVITTVYGATVMYGCSPTFIRCGNRIIECQANGTWSGVLPECTRSVATVESTSYTVREDGGTIGVGIILDRPNCAILNITVLPRVQSPVDASTFDFDSTTVMATIMPGANRTMVSIPITNDTVVEGPERFNVVISPNGNNGFRVGTPGQTEVTITDDADKIAVTFEMSMYNVTEVKGEVAEVCLLSSRTNEIQVTVTVQPEETGSAEEPRDFTLASSTVRFGAGQRRACYNQTIVDDKDPEPTETFAVRIVDNADAAAGNPSVAQISINDFDGSITQGPSNVSYIPGQTPLPIELTCTITGDFVTWRVNGTTYTLSNLMANPPPLAGHSANGNNTLINIPVNNTEYECVSNIPGLPGIPSYSAFVYFAGAPAMVSNVMIDIYSIITNNNNVSFTLNWDEPFANFDPIVNYTITINCSDASCPVMLTVTTTSASVNFITDLSMMTRLSVTASNTAGTSDPTTVVIDRPDRVNNVSLICGALDWINQCNATWNAVTDVMGLPTSYTVYYFGQNVINGSIAVATLIATIDLPAVDSDVNVVVTAVNAFGSGPSSNIAMNKIMSSSVTNATVTLDTPNENRTLHSITVNCTISLNSTADTCEVTASNDNQTLNGTAQITGRMAAVTVNGLECEVTYNITAGGTLNGDLVGPRSSHGTITAGYCPQVMTTATSPTTTITSSLTTTAINVTANVTTPIPTVTLDGGTVETTCSIILVCLTTLITMVM